MNKNVVMLLNITNDELTAAEILIEFRNIINNYHQAKNTKTKNDIKTKNTKTKNDIKTETENDIKDNEVNNLLTNKIHRKNGKFSRGRRGNRDVITKFGRRNIHACFEHRRKHQKCPLECKNRPENQNTNLINQISCSSQILASA